MKISQKIILSFLLVALIGVVTTYFTMRSYREINLALSHLIDSPTRKIEALNALKQAGMRIVSSTNEYGFIRNHTARTENIDKVGNEKKLTDQNYETFESSLKSYEDLAQTPDPETTGTTPNIKSSSEKLLRTSSDLIELTNNNQGGSEILEKRREFASDESTFLKYIDEALQKGSTEQIQGQKNVEANIAESTRRAVILRILNFILAISAGLYISFLISRRIGKLKEASRRVGRGELDTRIEIDSKDEIGDLSRSISKMVSDLKVSRSDFAAAKMFADKMLESMIDFVVVTDMDLNITQVNNAVLRLIGYDESELIGMPINMLAASKPFDQKGIDQIRNTGFATDLERLIQNKDGSQTPISMSLSVFKDEQGNDLGIVCVGKDISERKRAEAEREVISEIIQGVTTTGNLDELLQLIHRSIGSILNAENCYVALYDKKTDLLSVPFCIDKYDTPAAPAKLGTGLTAYVFRKRKPMLLTADVIRELCEKGDIAIVGTEPAIWLGVPLRTPEGVIGVLVVQHYENVDAYTDRDLKLLAAVGDQIALAIERKRVEEALRISDEQHRLLFETNPQPAFVYDRETLAFLAVNEAAISHYGYTRAEFLSEISVRHLVQSQNVKSRSKKVLDSNANQESVLAPSKHLKKDGSIIDVEITSQGLVFDGKPAEIVLVNDVSARHRLEAESKAISEIIQGVSLTANLDELLTLIHSSIGKILYAENCFVALHDASTDNLSFEFWADKFDPIPAPGSVGKSFSNYVLRTGKALLLSKEQEREMFATGLVERVGSESASWLGVPLITPERTVGVLVVQHYEIQGIYGQQDLEFLESVGDQIALAIERKRVDEELRNSEEQHRLLFESNPHPAFVVDLESLAFLAVNEAAIRHYGYSRDEFMTTITAKDLRPTADAADFTDRLSRARNGQDITRESTLHKKKDGTIIDIEITMHELTFAGKRAQIVRINDVTERLRLEAESAVISEVIRGVTTSSNLDELLKLVHLSIGRMLYAENCYVALLDPKTELLHLPLFVDKRDELPPPSKFGSGLTAYVLRKGKPMLMTKKVIDKLTKKGEIAVVGSLPAVWLGVPLRTPDGTIGVLVVQHYEDANAYDERDIAFLSSVGDQIALAIDRKRAEEVMKQSEVKFRDLFDNAPVAYHELDSDGRIININHTEELMLGYTYGELIGRHVSDLVVEKTSRDAVAAKLAGTQQLIPVERTFIRKDGTHISVLNEDRLMFGADGKVTGIRSTLQDITARKHAELQLSVFNDKLQQSNRELQDFAYVASHDLQEPLRKVQAFSDRLKTKFADKLEGEGLDYLERMRSAANRMQLLIQDLLTFSRVSTQAQPFVSVDLNKITREVLSDLEVKIEETGATVDFDDLPVLQADPMQMRQLIQNLIGNALKFRQSDTAPQISISSNPIKANGNGLGKCFEIIVKDNGIGFDEKYTDKIFAVFQRLHGRMEYEGSGVGLAICRKIVERHNGQIAAKSSPGAGASFAFTIPLKQKNPEVI